MPGINRANSHPLRRSRRLTVALAGAAVVVCAGLAATGSPAQDLQQKLQETEAKVSHAEHHADVLTTQISHYSDRISELEGKVADLRNQEAELSSDLAAKEAELAAAQAELERVRSELRQAIGLLESRLVAIYKSNDPDLLSVVLNADGFDDLLQRTQYLEHLNDQDSSIVSNVRDLRDRAVELVTTVKAARVAIVKQKRELEAVRTRMEAQSSELASARSRQRNVLSKVRDHKEHLEADLSDISKKIQEQLSQLGTATLPAGPIRGGSSGMIWPVNGPIASGFGMRWGRMHEGIDIAVPAGTPIRAALSGTIVLAAPTSGYGNYTCISHGGGLSTCYAHQSSFARTSGSISQGSILGYVGCTGHCFGDHLHFEVRINGQAVDPLGYL
jgi:murein DD-endopeptidase MepM/ murein hydrolase activator NlpD